MQKTTYEMRISYWFSDLCSSDLVLHNAVRPCGDGQDFVHLPNHLQHYAALLLQVGMNDDSGDHRAQARDRFELSFRNRQCGFKVYNLLAINFLDMGMDLQDGGVRFLTRSLEV